MTDPSTALKLTGPFSVTVSTPGTPSVATLQFVVANVSLSQPVKLRRGTLLVPVSTPGINVTSGAMTPKACTSHWTFASETDSPKPNYAAFALLPSGDGTITAGAGVEFELTSVTVDTTPGPAKLPFGAETSLGHWSTQIGIDLIPPSTVPHIQDAGLLPLMIQQNQETVLHWTATGAAYCEVTDDQNNVLGTNLPTEGALATLGDKPAQGNAQTKTAANGANYYTRGYTVTAHSTPVDDPDERPLSVQVSLPTIVKFAVTPLKLGDPVVVSWTLANVDPKSGSATLTIAPQDGTAAQEISVPLGTPDDNGLFGGSATVTPTPLPTTIYTLTIDSGYGASATQALTMTSPLAAGANLIISSIPGTWPEAFPYLASFDDKLWCAVDGSVEFSCTHDGTNWTQPSLPLGMSRVWGLLAADLGQGKALCVSGPEFAAWTRDGATWHRMAPPPMLAAWAWAATAAGIVACGGADQYANPLNQVWSNDTGTGWTQVSSSFPQGSTVGVVNLVALFDGKLYTVPLPYPEGTATAWSSADGGATWQAQAQPIPVDVSSRCALQVAGDELWLLGAGSDQADVLTLKRGGSWSPASWKVPAGFAFLATATHRGHLWLVVSTTAGPSPVALYVLNQVLPGTVFTLTAVQSDGAVAASGAPAERP